MRATRGPGSADGRWIPATSSPSTLIAVFGHDGEPTRSPVRRAVPTATPCCPDAGAGRAGRHADAGDAVTRGRPAGTRWLPGPGGGARATAWSSCGLPTREVDAAVVVAGRLRARLHRARWRRRRRRCGLLVVRRQLRPLREVADDRRAGRRAAAVLGRDRADRAGARAPHRRGTPRSARWGPRSTPCWSTWSRRWRPGTAASSRCGSSSRTPRTSCARRSPPSRGTPSWPAAARTTRSPCSPPSTRWRRSPAG